MTARRTQGLAWTVMLVALGVFCAAAVGLPYASFRYVSAATAPEAAMVERTEGSITLDRAGITVLLEPSGSQTASAPEGTEVTTLGDGRAFVRLFDESTASLEPGTKLTLVSMRRPQFSAGNSQPNVELKVVSQGPGPARLSIGTAWRGTQFRLMTNDATLTMGAQSRAQLTTGEDGTKVYAVAGSVTVSAAGRTVTLRPDRITEVRPGKPPEAPRPALSDVLKDGDFRQTVRQSWLVRAEGEPLGTVKQLVLDGNTLLDMQRERSDGEPGDVVLVQDLGPYDLSGASWLGVSTTLRIDDQSLPAGGERGTEYPVSLRLVVERHDGSEDVPWDVGFYAIDPNDPNPPLPGALGIVAVPVPIGRWVDFRSGNLLDPSDSAALLLSDGTEIADNRTRAALDAVERFQLAPRNLLRFEVKGSGHDWHAWLDRLSLWSK